MAIIIFCRIYIPRASINISKLLRGGVEYRDAVELCIFKGCEESIKKQIPQELLELYRPKPEVAEVEGY